MTCAKQNGAKPVPDLKRLIRTIPDYPKPGVMFRDVTTLMGDRKGFKAAIEQMAAPFSECRRAGRGRHRGARLYSRRRHRRPARCGFVPFRKKGKLPWKTIGQEYTLEYGVDIIEMHEDAIDPGERILIVDDLIATGVPPRQRPSWSSAPAAKSSEPPSSSTCRSWAGQSALPRSASSVMR
jgi:adenine phosphoribosyltransferase